MKKRPYLTPGPTPDADPFDTGDAPTVLASRSVADLPTLQESVVRTDGRIADLLLSLVRETAAARNDEARLLSVICDFGFRAFPSATHHLLVVREEGHDELRTLIARSRSGEEQKVALSRTIVTRVMSGGMALLISHGTATASSVRSIAITKLETAICAPLISLGKPFGVIQLDIRRPGRGIFHRDDVDLLSVFASQVSLALDHLRLYQQQRRALQSTINALVHSLLLKDPEAAHHSERVQAVAVELGRALGLPESALEILSVASVLHDLGKQGIRDDLLFKPDRLTDDEREEMSQHASHTQTILDKIEYPEHLRDVPRIAAYHHEKMDGTGPFSIAGDDIPLQSRIISVADVFDALVSPRVYKDPLPIKNVLAVLERGKGTEWDPQVVHALRHALPRLLETVYTSLRIDTTTPEAEENKTGLDRAA